MLPYWNLGGTLFPTYSLLTLLGAAAAWLYFHRQLKARGEKPRPDRASLSLWGSGGIGRRKISLPAAPAAPAAPGPPCWRPIRPPFPPATSRVGSSLWRAVRRSGRGLAVLPAAQGPLFPNWGADLVPAVPLFHTFGRVGCFLAGCCYGIPAPRRLAGGDLSGLSRGPQRRGAPPPSSCMRPPAACPLFSAAPPGPAGLEGEALLLVYLAAYALFRFALEFLRGDAARGDGGYFPPLSCWLWLLWPLSSPPDPPSPYVKTAAPVTYRPRLFFFPLPRLLFIRSQRLGTGFQNRTWREKSRNASIREAISWAVIGSSSRSRRASSWHTSGE